MHTLILKGQVCFSLAPDELLTVPDCYLVAEDGICRGFFTQLPAKYQGLPVEDHSNNLIIPGMSDLHVHAPQYAFRGLGMDLELIDWLDTSAFPEEIRYKDPDYARNAYRVFAEDLKNSPTTRACIFATQHTDATLILMDLLEETGLITRVGKVNMDREAPPELQEESAEVSEQETIRWLEACPRYERTLPILTPRFIPSCTDELMERLSRIRSEYRLPVQSHLSENPGEIDWVADLCPDAEFYGDAYDRFGLFGGDHPCVMAHCVWSPPEEIARMKKNHVFVAHCPASNTNLSSGIAPMRKYLEEELEMGLGSDIAGGHSLSLFRSISDAIQVSKLYWRLVDPSCRPLTFPEAFWMATAGGGRFFGNVGSFLPGYDMDAVVVSDANIHHHGSLSLSERLERLIYLSPEQVPIRAKYVRGQKIL